MPPLLVLLGAVLLAAGPGWVPGRAEAAPVRTLAVEPAGEEKTRFAADLRVLWANLTYPTPERLSIVERAGARARLRLVARHRADFGVVPARIAATGLDGFPRLAAIAVLWPDFLHAATRDPKAREFSFPPSGQVWVFGGESYAVPLLRQLAGGSPRGQRRIRVRSERALAAALDSPPGPILVFSGRVPFGPLAERMAAGGGLRLLPFSHGLLEELKLGAPWLMTGQVKRGAYPGLAADLEWPAHYRILVGRRRLPSATVRKMLRTVYKHGRSMRLFNPLFQDMGRRLNAVFAKMMPFHPATERRFNFQSNLP